MTYFYHSVVDSPHLPRGLEANSAQSAVITLLGEIWPSGHAVPVPSAALVAVLGRTGLTEAAVRAALSRLSRKGTLDVVKDGRQTMYCLSDEVRADIPVSQVLTMGFGASERPWSGEWTVTVFSLPETQRDRRQALRDWLRWLGFAPIRDGVWISPHADLQLTERALRDLLPPDGLVFRSAHVVGTVNPMDVWPLDGLVSEYHRFIEEFRPYIYDLRAGAISPAEALRLWLTVLGRWRGFPTLDPDLPAGALPANWPRREARHVFEAIHDATVYLAVSLVRQIVADYSVEAARAARALTVAEVLEEHRGVSLTPATDQLDLTAIGPGMRGSPAG